jgi:ribulose-phosphate 3-epimerase
MADTCPTSPLGRSYWKRSDGRRQSLSTSISWSSNRSATFVFAEAGADHLLVHADPGSTVHLHQTLSQVRALGKKAGVVLDPASPLELIEYVLHLCDVVLVMTVNPGFGGQSFLPEMLPKIRRLRAICAERDLHPVIEVDGGENSTTAGTAAAAGATAIVAGSAIFGTRDYAAAIAAIRTNATAAAQS